MRYIGIDYGVLRVGIAVSDERGRLAFPLCDADNSGKLLEYVAGIISERKIEAIVVGDTLTTGGDDNSITLSARRFAHALEKKTGLPLFYEREAMSSMEAARFSPKQSRKSSEKIKSDASAAAIILQRFLDKRSGVILPESDFVE